MSYAGLLPRLHELAGKVLPLPGAGRTPERHRCLQAVGREDLTLAKLAEAHWDALAILAEAGKEPAPGAIYAVWASEIPGNALTLEEAGKHFLVSGTKPFCSGLGLVDRALITAGGPLTNMVEVDLKANASRVSYDLSVWKVGAFTDTRTGSLTFSKAEVSAPLGDSGWYLERPGFWHGACGPAACWAGGVLGLLDYAQANKRSDPHTLAHLGAISANVWAMSALLDRAGQEIDETPRDTQAAQLRALQLRQLVEMLGTDCLRRFARAYGPYPLAMNESIARRYHETDLYLRQSHAERDLEALGRIVTAR